MTTTDTAARADDLAPASAATVHEAVARRAVEAPNAVALSEGDRRTSYAELDAAAERLAARLRAVGLGREARVGVHVPRGTDFVVAALAALKAGAAYVPLDVGYPPQALARVAREARLGAVVTAEGGPAG
ncbi:AMP-binding protein, partial [Streptomyces triticirhizae]